jgi:NitT/TauT family transport system permease protein
LDSGRAIGASGTGLGSAARSWGVFARHRLAALLRTMLRGYPIVIMLAAWQLLSTSGLVPARLLPDLGLIFDAIVTFVASGDFWYHSSFTLERILISFALAVPLGVTIGTLLARSRTWEALFEPMFLFGYSVPKIALYPVFVFIFGFGGGSKISLAALEALYPIAISTYYGVRSADRTLIWAAQNMGAGPRRIFFKVLLPSALPFIFSSLRIAMHVALVVIILLEIIGDNRGLGYYVTYATASYQYAAFFAGIAAIMLWGFVLDQITNFLRDVVVFWQRPIKRA